MILGHLCFIYIESLFRNGSRRENVSLKISNAAIKSRSEHLVALPCPIFIRAFEEMLYKVLSASSNEARLSLLYVRSTILS